MSFLVTRPEDDETTLYLSEYSKDLIRFAEAKGIEVFDCFYDKATREKVTAILLSKKPKLIMFNGHGNEDVITGHKFEPLIRKDDNDDLIKDSLVYARSCKCASSLGKVCSEKGTGAFIGYEGKFKFWTCNNSTHLPKEDEYAKPFLESTNQIVSTLLKGNTAEEAHQRGYDALEQVIEKLERSDAPQDLIFMLPLLYWDQQTQKCLGNKNLQI